MIFLWDDTEHLNVTWLPADTVWEEGCTINVRLGSDSVREDTEKQMVETPVR